MIESDIAIVSDASSIKYIKWLNALYLAEERKNESLGFFPLQTFERELSRDRIWVALYNGQPLGYIYFGAMIPGRDVKIFQACLEFDMRKQTYGRVLVNALLKVAQASGCRGLSLRCGFDLEANEFWKAMGFYVTAHVQGGLRRNRVLNVWRTDFYQDLFSFPVITAASGKRDARLWNKYKDKLTLSDTSRVKQSWDDILPLLHDGGMKP